MLRQEFLDELWDAADPKSTEQRLRGADTNRFMLPADRAELATQIARVLGLQERFAEACAVLDGIDPDKFDTADKPDGGAIVRVRLALERGRLHRTSGSPAAAVRFLGEAAQLAGEHGFSALEQAARALMEPGPQD
jgi:hypothetical protein